MVLLLRDDEALAAKFILSLSLSLSADIDECVSGGGVCPRRRKCVNTFGSFMCKCHLGFKLTYINGRYTCIGEAETQLPADSELVSFSWSSAMFVLVPVTTAVQLLDINLTAGFKISTSASVKIMFH